MSAFQNYSDNNYTITAPVKDLSNGSIDFRHPERVRRFHDTYHNEALTVRGGVVNRPWADRLLFGFTLAGMHKDIQNGVRQEVVYGEKYRFGHSFMPSLQYAKRNLLHNRLDLVLTANYYRNLTTNVDTSAYAFNWRGERVLRNSPGEQNYLHLRYDDHNWNADFDARSISTPAVASPSTTVLPISIATPPPSWLARTRNRPSHAPPPSTSADSPTSLPPTTAGM